MSLTLEQDTEAIVLPNHWYTYWWCSPTFTVSVSFVQSGYWQVVAYHHSTDAIWVRQASGQNVRMTNGRVRLSGQAWLLFFVPTRTICYRWGLAILFQSLPRPNDVNNGDKTLPITVPDNRTKKACIYSMQYKSIIADPIGEATNHDALSLRVCIYVCI